MSWKKLSDQMSFGNSGLQLWFFSQLHEDKCSNRSMVWGLALWGVTEAEHLNRHHLHPFLKKSFNIVCLNDDLQETAGYVLLWSI